jgi:hypothetical protein
VNQQEAPGKKREQIDAQQKSAAERREQHLAQKQLSAKKSAQKIQNAKGIKDRELREKKAALDQRMKDASVRRSVGVERRVAQQALLQRRKEANVIEIPVSEGSPPTSPSKVAARLASYSAGKQPLTMDKVQERMREAEARRQQYQYEQSSPAKKRDRQQRVEINRVQIQHSKRYAAAAGNLKRANAEENRRKLTEQKTKKASQQYSRAKARNASMKDSERDHEGKMAAVAGKQNAAALRREQFLMDRKESAERSNNAVQEKRREKEHVQRKKKAAIEQKQKDAAVRRSVAGHQKTWKHKQYCPPKTPSGTPPAKTTPTKQAFGKWAEVASNASELEGGFTQWQEATKTQSVMQGSFNQWQDATSVDDDAAEAYTDPRQEVLAEVGRAMLRDLVSFQHF